MATATATTTAVQSQYKKLTHSIRPLTRIINFLRKYPPSQYSAMATGQAIPTTRQRRLMGAKPLSSTNLPQADSIPIPIPMTMTATAEIEEDMDKPPHHSLQDTTTTVSADSTSSSSTKYPPNPFLPYKNPTTGLWRGARIGLRQQADLFKYARQHGVESLLPASVKSSVYKQARLLEGGLMVKGTGEGQQVKGHKWERRMAGTLEKRRAAMEGMPEMIRLWEQRGHGRGWKKYPK